MLRKTVLTMISSMSRPTTTSLRRTVLRGVMHAMIVPLVACLVATQAAAAADPANRSERATTAISGSPSTPAVVFAGRIAGDKTSTRLFFDLDRKIDFAKFFMARPARLVIDGPTMLFRFAEPKLIEPRGLVTFLRYGAITASKSRIVVSLAGPARITHFEVAELEKGAKYRLIIDLAPEDEAAFRQTIAKQQRLFGTSGEVATKGDRVRVAPKQQGRFTIIVDPGHGGIDSGAVGVSGTQEKDLTLAVGRQIAARIAEAGPFDVKMTRDTDVFLSLNERVSFAERNHADLVISVHADTLRQHWVRGATVYTLSKKASDQIAHELAQSENMSDLVAGLDSPEQQDVVHDILADLTARETGIFSRRFSSLLVRQLDNKINLIKNPQRSAAFVVLKAPEIPSVLVELGYLSNAKDEKLMAEADWQDRVARRVAEAVHDFFATRRP